jgi:hypothetical protein
VKGIPRVVIVRKILALLLKKCYRKGCQIFAAYMEETRKDKVSNIKYCVILKKFEDVFKEIPGLTPKRDNDFSINMMPKETPVSKTPYQMSTPELNELKMKLEKIMKRGYIHDQNLAQGSNFSSKINVLGISSKQMRG